MRVSEDAPRSSREVHQPSAEVVPRRRRTGFARVRPVGGADRARRGPRDHRNGPERSDHLHQHRRCACAGGVGSSQVLDPMAVARGGGHSSPRVLERGGESMIDMLTAIRRLALRDEGQDLMEYGLLAALIAIVAMVSVSALGNQIFNVFWQNIAQAV